MKDFLYHVVASVRGWLQRRAAWRREQRIVQNCGCICWCPCCREPLNDQAGMLKAGVWDNLVVYQCSKCRTVSRWDFNTPVPICRGQGLP